MKIVKPIYLSFKSANGSLNQTSAKVHVPFAVKFARVVSCAYFSTNTQSNNVFFVTSDMTDDQPMSIQNCSTTLPAVYSQDMNIEYSVPKRISSSFTFYLKKVADGTPFNATDGDSCGMIVEFYDENSHYYRSLDTSIPFQAIEIPRL